MKRPYSGESWTRFKELMQKLTKRTAIVETRAQNNEDKLSKLQSDVGAIETKSPKYLSRMTLLSEGSDLNEITKYGMYCATPDVLAQTIKNLPEGVVNSFVLEVSDPQGANGTRIRQRLTLYMETAVEYIRYMDSNKKWFDWRKTVDNQSIIQPDQGGTGWKHGLNSGINIVLDTSSEWSEWITPSSYNVVNASASPSKAIVGVAPPLLNVGDIYTRYIEIEFENVTRTEGQVFQFFVQGLVNDSWTDFTYKNPAYDMVRLNNDSIPENGVYRYVSYMTMNNEKYLDFQKFSIIFRCDYWATGRFRYRCLKIERGHVDYPQWSPAPEDIAKISVPENITKINDYTTGNNLIRASRDFRIGTDVVTSTCYKDGWNNTGTFTFYKDEDGYTVATKTNTGATTDMGFVIRSSAIYGLFNNDTITISGEVMVADLDRTDVFLVFNIWNSENTRTSYKTFSFQQAGINNIQPNKWYEFSVVYTLQNDVPDNGFCNMFYELQRNGTISFRKLMVQPGDINHPIYAPNPNDIDYINDETSGINLLRGTRDFSIGSKFFGKTWYIDGFRATTTSYRFEIGEDGFVVASGIVNDNTGFYQVVNTELTPGDVYTLFFEYRITNPEFTKTKPIGYLVLEDSDSNTSHGQSITATNTEIGIWHKGIMYYTVPDIDVSGKKLRGGPNSPEMGIEFRKPGVYKGHINNPIWSASPFDVASVEVENNKPLYLGRAGAITKDSDLDDYKTPGVYGIGYGDAQTFNVANLPVKNGGKLIVEYGNPLNANAYIRQRFIEYTEAATEYIRIFSIGDNNKWTTWRKTYANTTVRPIEGGGTGVTTLNELKALVGSSASSSKVDTYLASSVTLSENTSSKVAMNIVINDFSLANLKNNAIVLFKIDSSITVDEYTRQTNSINGTSVDLIIPSGTYSTGMYQISYNYSGKTWTEWKQISPTPTFHATTLRADITGKTAEASSGVTYLSLFSPYSGDTISKAVNLTGAPIVRAFDSTNAELTSLGGLEPSKDYFQYSLFGVSTTWNLSSMDGRLRYSFYSSAGSTITVYITVFWYG